MDAPNDTSTPKRARRRRGQRLEAQERAQAQAAFLTHFAKYANVAAACRKVGIDRSTVYQWQEHDETFLLRYRQAELDAADVLRREAFRRAVVGWDEPMVSAGKMVCTVRKKSDAVLLAMLKARVPEYREKVDINATVQGAMTYDLNLAEDAEASNAANAFLRRLTALRAGDASGTGVSGE